MPSDVKRLPEELLATYETAGETCAQNKHLFIREQKTQDTYFNLQSTLYATGFYIPLSTRVRKGSLSLTYMQTGVSLFPPQIHTRMLFLSNHLSTEYYMGNSCSVIGASIKAGLDETERSCVYKKLWAKTEIFSHNCTILSMECCRISLPSLFLCSLLQLQFLQTLLHLLRMHREIHWSVRKGTEASLVYEGKGRIGSREIHFTLNIKDFFFFLWVSWESAKEAYSGNSGSLSSVVSMQHARDARIPPSHQMHGTDRMQNRFPLWTQTWSFQSTKKLRSRG